MTVSFGLFLFTTILYLILLPTGLKLIVCKSTNIKATSKETHWHNYSSYATAPDTSQTGYCWYGSYCESSSILFRSLYEQQKMPFFYYQYLCYFRFVALFKQNHTHDMMLFGSIFRQNSSNLTLRLMKQVYEQANSVNHVVNYRLVVRFDGDLDMPGKFANKNQIVVGNRTFMLNLTGGVYEYMIPETLHYGKNDMNYTTLQFPNQWMPYIESSYAVVCINPYHFNMMCDFVVKDTQIECYCPTDKLGYIIMVLFLLVTLPLLYWLIDGPLCADAIRSSPEMQFNPVLCQVQEATYENLVVFRFGPATDGFNYEKSHIDIQLLTTNDEPVGAPVRFSTAKLPDRTCGECYMVVLSISPLPPIRAIRASHSSTNQLIHLYDFFVVNSRENGEVLQVEAVNRFVTDQEVILRVTPDLTMSEQTKTNIAHPVAERLNMKKFDWMPTTLAMLSTFERLSFCILAIGMDFVALMATRVYLGYFGHWKKMGFLWAEFVGFLVMATLAGLLLLGSLEWLFVKFIKRYYVIERHVQTTAPETASHFWLYRLLWLIGLNAIGLGLYCYTIYLGIRLDMASVGLLSGAALCTIIITIAIWHLLDETVFARLCAVRGAQDFSCMVTDAGQWCSAGSAGKQSKSLYSIATLSISRPSDLKSKSIAVNSSDLMPKLTNPNGPVRTPVVVGNSSSLSPSKSCNKLPSKSRSLVNPQISIPSMPQLAGRSSLSTFKQKTLKSHKSQSSLGKLKVVNKSGKFK